MDFSGKFTERNGRSSKGESTDLAGFYGGAERDRTADLLVANEALSQLSYSPPTRRASHTAFAGTTPSNNLSECTSKRHLTQTRRAPPTSLRKLTHSPRHRRPRSQRLLHHMPHFTLIHHHTKHWNHQPRPTPSNGLQHPNIADGKFSPIQRHLPALPATQARLLANIRHHARKLGHPRTFYSSTCTQAGGRSKL
jgi:hypothetical protein